MRITRQFENLGDRVNVAFRWDLTDQSHFVVNNDPALPAIVAGFRASDSGHSREIRSPRLGRKRILSLNNQGALQ